MVETEKYSCGGSKARLAMSTSPLLAGHMMDDIATERPVVVDPLCLILAVSSLSC